MTWYAGPPLLEHLETVPIEGAAPGIAPFRMAVQWVNRTGQDFRGYAGTIASGRVRTGDAVAILPSGRTTRIERIVTAAGERNEASAGEAVTLTLADAVDCSRGDLIAAAGAAAVTGTLDATLVWMAEAPLDPHRSYWLKTGAQTASATVTVGEVLAVDGGESRTGALLALNDIGRARIALDRRIAATLYADNRALGGFILIDKATHATVAAGMIGGFPGTAAVRTHVERIFWVPGEKEAETLQGRFAAQGRRAFVLTEAALREGLCSDLGPEAATELVRRAAEVARLMSATGVTIIAAIPLPPGVAVPGALVGAEAAGEDWVI
jgi:bifunctional enzyme CysN/CysC